MSLANMQETINIDGTEVEVYYYENPMSHEDWHDVENLGLEYVDYVDNGGDYWDDYLIFCKKGFKLEVTGYFLEKRR